MFPGKEGCILWCDMGWPIFTCDLATKKLFCSWFLSPKWQVRFYSEEKTWFRLENLVLRIGVVVHFCNPSNSGVKTRGLRVVDQPGQSYWDLISKNKIKIEKKMWFFLLMSLIAHWTTHFLPCSFLFLLPMSLCFILKTTMKIKYLLHSPHIPHCTLDLCPKHYCLSIISFVLASCQVNNLIFPGLLCEFWWMESLMRRRCLVFVPF
jgi:hypothetical protein